MRSYQALRLIPKARYRATCGVSVNAITVRMLRLIVSSSRVLMSTSLTPV